MTVIPNPVHPAKFSEPILDLIGRLVDEETRRVGRPLRIIDPMCGVGRVHDLTGHAVGGDLELGWAACRRPSVQADASHPPFRPHSFDVYVTSGCLEQSHRVLTNDLRWVPVGDLRVGDDLLTFEESAERVTARGSEARRRWRRAMVVRSEPRTVECVRVILANGDELVTTPNHPWLTHRYAYRGGPNPEWVMSSQLAGTIVARGDGTGRGWKAGAKKPYYVMKQTDTWTPLTSYDAGWLAGIFDGEGTIGLGAHGSPKLQMCQVEGPVLDRAERLMEQFGYAPNRILRKPHRYRQTVGNLYVTGGFPGVLRALGELRPIRLLNRWEELDVSTRTIQAESVAVLAVEPAGRRDIQEIETTEGTYIGEGYLHHNTYANRMADNHVPRDTHKACGGDGCRACKGTGISPRKTYRVANGGALHAANTGAMPWGARYRDAHIAIWARIPELVAAGGLVIVNISDHIRDGVEQHVAAWHYRQLQRSGVTIVDVFEVPTDRMLHGENYEARPDAEYVFAGRVAS